MMTRQKNNFKKFLLQSFFIIFKNCQKNLAQVKEIKEIDDEEQELAKEIFPYLILGAKLIFDDFKFCLAEEASFSVKKEDDYLKLESTNLDKFINFAKYHKYKFTELRVPKSLKTSSRNRIRYFILLVNIMAFMDLGLQDKKFMHNSLMRLLMIIFGSDFTAELSNSNTIHNDLSVLIANYIIAKESNDSVKLLEYIYGNTPVAIRFEELLFESYSILLQMSNRSSYLMSWIFEINDSNSKNDKVVIGDNHEGYYGLLFYINDCTESINIFEQLHDDLSNESYIL